MAQIIYRHFGGNFGAGPTLEGFYSLMKAKVGHEECPICHKLWNEHANDEMLACFKADDLRIDYHIAPLTVELAILFGVGRVKCQHAAGYLLAVHGYNPQLP